MSKIIPALDFDNSRDAIEAVALVSSEITVAKVGLETFISEGPEVIRAMRRLGVEVFLDLKLNDIPNQVYHAVKAIMKYGVVMTTVHTTGGVEMMNAAARAVSESKYCMILLGVTMLTSMSQEELNAIGCHTPVEDQVVHLAKLAKASGLNGVVASAHEIKAIRQACGDDFLIVTPGIRPKTWPADDQLRTMSPRDAVQAGANYLVVGRPIFASEDPLEACRELKIEIGEQIALY